MEATDITIAVQESTTLTSWNTLTPDGVTIVEETLDPDVDGDGNVAMMRVRVRVDEAAASSQFLRLLISD